MDQSKVETLWRDLLIEIGENPDREGLQGTPKRIAKMYCELFRGYDKKQLPKVTTFKNGKDGIVYDQMITDEGSFYSQCEHHVIPFFGSYHFVYIPNPNGKILGLSKVARVVDYFGAKLQIQERLVSDIVNYLWEELTEEGVTREGIPFKNEPIGMGLIMTGEHLCKTMRGAKKKGLMTCSYMKGCFATNKENCKEEFLNLIKLK